MPDICLFYSKGDKRRVEQLGDYLKSLGWDVWWFKYTEQGNWEKHVKDAILSAKCVIPIWTKISVDTESDVVNEAKLAKKNQIPRYPIRLDDVDPPIHFLSENTTDLLNWNGMEDHQGIKDLTEKLISVLGDKRNQKWDKKRPYEVALNGVVVKLPCFVRSVSSHETQISPEDALKAMEILHISDAILISAYDMYLPKDANLKEKKTHKNMLRLLEESKKKGCLILMDSGNYEASRKNELKLTEKQVKKGVKQKIKNEYLWTEKKYRETIEYTPFTLAFCFDDIYPPNSVNQIVDDVIKRTSISPNVVPIVHAPLKKDGSHNVGTLPAIFVKLAQQIKPEIIAIPERELGDGIIERAKVVQNIRLALNELDFYQPIHLLGTGNPLSIAIFSVAGADLFDGLEWCRTTADRTEGRLLHHQHLDLLLDQTIENSLSPYVKNMLIGSEGSAAFKLAGHNLDFMDEWMKQLREDMMNGEVVDMLNCYLPNNGIKKLRESKLEFFV